MAHSGYGGGMEILTVVIALALSVELVLHYRLHQRVENLSRRLHRAEVDIARLKADFSFLDHCIEQQDEEHRLLRGELAELEQRAVKE